MKQKVHTPAIANCARCKIPGRLQEDWDFRDTWKIICFNCNHSTKYCRTGHRAICRWNNAQARIADELDRLQPLPAFPPITSHPLAIEARALLRGGPTTIPLPPPQTGEAAELAPVAELDDQQREAVHQAVAEALGSGAYDCTRVWESWSVGTMGPDDFALIAEDSDRVAEIADAAIEAIRAIPLPVPVAENKLDDAFMGGVCVSLALVTAHGEATIWREIVRAVGTDSLLNYAANVNPDDWNLAGFGKYAQSELGKGKPDPAPQAKKAQS